MRSTRTNSFKSKFKNTQETVLNLDEDDDDFIAPPIGLVVLDINIVSMGFGSLLNIDMDTASGLLNYYLLDHYDPDSSRLVLENMVITIMKDTVHDMLGLPNIGEELLSMINEKDN
ncbi:unnamed protein product [Lactuca saligna]|uniref:Uncharacterized protein n=1 Tax=Lactuca saligna TaxID=75948 RepID=A0AA35YNS5_LACSI|nr:unnamed protein product [Lactuca saligna]